MGKHVLILGGGFGGLAAAHTLRSGLGIEHRITLVDKQPLFMMGLTKLWLLNGSRQVGENAGKRSGLSERGIDFLEAEVSSVDVPKREVRAGTRRLSYDYLIVALGADYAPDATPGFAKHAKNLYTESGCAGIRDALRSFDAGIITILVCGTPFKCPPAPYEASMIIDDVFRKRGIRDNVKLQVITPEAHPLTVLGPEAGKITVGLLHERGIEYYPSHKVKEIQRDRIVTEDGKQVRHDLVLGVPVHVAPTILKQSGLVDQSGWVPVNPSTLETNVADIYAIGDCAGTKIPKGLLLPRAGVLAEEEGKVVAANIVHDIQGDGQRTMFEGQGVCFMEVGDGKAAPLRSHFFAQPEPKWEFTPPSAGGFEEKRRFLSERMTAWFP